MNSRTKIGVVVSALAVLPLGVMAVPASASTECTVERLPLPNGVDIAYVRSADPSGRYILGRSESTLLWVDGEVHELPDPPPNSFSYANDVNGAGTVVGYADDGQDHYRPWRYVDGTYTWLAVPDGIEDAYPTAINSRGEIVGHGYDEDSFQNVPLYWPADDPDTVRVLAGPDSGSAVDISDNGVVIGGWHDADGVEHGGYVWEDVDSEGRQLFGSGENHDTDPRTISGDLVAGADGSQRGGAVWNLATGEIATYEKKLQAINSGGDVTYQDAWPAVIVRADGTTAKLASLDGDRPRGVVVLFDPGSDVTAAGYAKDETRKRPVVWRGC